MSPPSPPLRQGLARLLELLSNWFNVTLGDTLKDYLLKMVADHSQAAAAAAGAAGAGAAGGGQMARAWRPGEEPKIAGGEKRNDVCACVNVRASVSACIYVCVCLCVCMGACVRLQG